MIITQHALSSAFRVFLPDKISPDVGYSYHYRWRGKRTEKPYHAFYLTHHTYTFRNMWLTGSTRNGRLYDMQEIFNFTWGNLRSYVNRVKQYLSEGDSHRAYLFCQELPYVLICAGEAHEEGVLSYLKTFLQTHDIHVQSGELEACPDAYRRAWLALYCAAHGKHPWAHGPSWLESLLEDPLIAQHLDK